MRYIGLFVFLFTVSTIVTASVSALAASKCPKKEPANCNEKPATAEAANSNSEVASKLSFSYGSKLDCSKVRNSRYAMRRNEICVGSGPKEWTAKEKALLDDVIRDIMKYPKLRAAFLEISKGGPIRLQRSKTLMTEEGSGPLVPATDAYAYVNELNELTVTDFFFKEAARMEKACTGYLFDTPSKELARVLVHELGHVYSHVKGGLDRDCTLLQVSGWNDRGDQHSKVDAPALEALRERGRALSRAKKHAEAASWTKTEAQKRGAPTLYALSSPPESFAELFTFLAMDETASTYIDPKVVKWFDDNVYSGHPKGVACATETNP